MIPNYTAVENVALTLELNKFNKPVEQAKELLERFGLKQRFYNLPSQLSGGEQQRVAIARAIAMKPELILADEPTGNLDSTNAEAVHDLLIKLNRDLGQTIVVVTHNKTLASLGKTKWTMIDGKLNSI